MKRYLQLFWIQLRASLLLAMQYRYEFIVDMVISVFWTATALVPLFVVFTGERPSVGGWSFAEALLVVGWFTLLGAVLEGAINPSLTSVVDHIRKGTLDFVLLKPADAQFLVSTAKFSPSKASNAIGALIIFVYAFRMLGRAPTVEGLVTAAILMLAAVAILYSLWIVTISAAFYVVRIDNLTYLFQSIFDAARWPISLFPGAVRIAFTFVIPLALMTTYPAEAMLGRRTLPGVVFPLCAAVVFAVVARAIWTRSLGKYTSASS